MMHGYGGMGPGMMGGYGPGGMMAGGIGPYEAGVLNLNDEQQRRLEQIQREGAREHWQLMQEQRAQHQRLLQQYRDGAPDPQALGNAYERMAEAQRRMLEHQAQVHNRMREVLTDEQRERIDQMRRFRWQEPDEE
jgi:Spy/CpxP family protein refolding chaperone